MNQAYVINGRASTVVIDVEAQQAKCAYWGTKLSTDTSVDMLRLLNLRQEVPASPQTEVALGLCPTLGQGFTGNPGISVHSGSDHWAVSAQLSSVEQSNACELNLTSKDSTRNLELKQRIKLDQETDVLSISTQIINLSNTILYVDWCASATVPIASHIDHRLAFEGHWAMEFQIQKSTQMVGSYVRENRRGRTSHDSFPGLILHAADTSELRGECYGFHLGWSGNHKVVNELMADGRAYLQLGELLYPGEIALEAGQSYQTPELYMSFSKDGFSGLSQQFHRYVRQRLMRPQVKQVPRPVHYNTWEGIYFEHNMPTLLDLVHRAAAIGVERFVLDDGWFPGRDDDTAGLGDWFVDTSKYPEGLTPLIDAVTNRGMQFGLWVEPEMVNPNSELYRQHPDWVLACQGNQQIGFRNQLVLDLTRPEVFDYLFERLNSLLGEYDISYLKWDMNRDINHPGDTHGQPAIHKQTQEFYALLAKIRRAHPRVEIESCASGGGRADYGVLQHTDRIWTSDSNDALDRLRIQRGFSYFFPSELMGSHVGPRDCHITHRHIDMGLRASVALFGHMGMEMDLRELTSEEQKQLGAMVALYKQHRLLIHSGDLFRLDTAEYVTSFGIVAQNKEEALFSYHLIAGHSTGMPRHLRFAGLDANQAYRLSVLWPQLELDKPVDASVFGFDTCLPKIDKQLFSGEVLMSVGLQMPRLVPQSNVIFYLAAAD